MKLTEREKQEAIDSFRSLQKRLWTFYEGVDGTSRIEIHQWDRLSEGADLHGGLVSVGTYGVSRGPIIEKSGVTVATVSGDTYNGSEVDQQGKPFWSAGLTACTHMFNPHAPSSYLNLQLLHAGERLWVSGSADLTSMIRYADDGHLFQDALREACMGSTEGEYESFRKASEDRFQRFLGRGEGIGVAGICFDTLKGDLSSLIGFMDSVGSAFLKAYAVIVKRRIDTPFSDGEKERQLWWRSLCVEHYFTNDRGTRYGLSTSAHPEAALVAMPPLVKW